MWLKCHVCLLAMPDLRRNREEMCEPGHTRAKEKLGRTGIRHRGSREGNKIGVDYASSCRLLGACRHHMVVADVGFCRLALRGAPLWALGTTRAFGAPQPL